MESGLRPDRLLEAGTGLLAGKVAFVTGAAQGIGLATARTFAEQGASVVMSDVDVERLHEASVAVLAGCPRARILALDCDVRQPESVRSAFQTVLREFKRLDVLVANAGVLGDGLIGMLTEDQMHEVFEVNVFGLLRCTQYASRLMQRSGQGSIIHLASIFGTHGETGQAAYGGSKAAVVGITRSLAKELAGQGIRVNALAPGFIDTRMTRSVPPEHYERRLASIAMRRIGRPQDVANAALFLASDLSAYVTGQVLGVDGGMLV